MRSLLAKLGYLLSEEYTLIRGVNADIQYINDELATMQSFLRAYGGSHGDLMKDWMKQIRDITYDIEDCIDDSGHRLHGLRAGTPCYFLLSSLHELLTWWPRRDISSRISILKMRAQQIGERRDRYGVNNLDPGPTGSGTPPVAGFDVADNQAASLLQLVATRNPVGVEKHLDKLDRRVTCIVGFGGVGKTAIATALYRNFGEEFGHRAVVTVSQSSDLEAILRVIKDQVKPHTRNHEQQDGSEKKDGLAAAAIKRVWDHVSRGTSDVMTKCCRPGTSEHRRDRDHLKEELVEHLKGNRYLILIDDVWSAATLDSIINALPENENSRIIVTTRFHDVATTRREGDIRIVKGLAEQKSKELFMQAFRESKGRKHAIALPQASATVSRGEPAESSMQAVSRPEGSNNVPVPDQVWKICGGAAIGHSYHGWSCGLQPTQITRGMVGPLQGSVSRIRES
ncbi:hypothetical protein ACQ4PT_017182 [Festuca glaucescens]